MNDLHADMHEMNLAAVDLNLLVVLEALLRRRSVTAAGRELGRSQPAMSHALARLRALLGDALLVPGKGGLVCTPRAEVMRGPLGELLQQTRRVLAGEARFDVASARRVFRVGGPDLVGVLAPQVWAWREEAPGITLELSALVAGEAQREALESGALDVALGPAPPEGERWRAQRLGSLPWVSLVRAGHVLEGACDRASWLEWPHVVVRTGSESASMVGQALEGEGRRVGFVAPSFTVALCVVASSAMVLTTPCTGEVAARFGLTRLTPPVALPAAPLWMYWHERWQADPGHRWLRETLGGQLREALAYGDDAGGA